MEKNISHTFEKSGRKITIYPGQSSDSPVIYLNTFEEEGDRIYRALREITCADVTLVAISGLNWYHDMSPWDIPPVTQGDTPCTGGADAYLQVLTEEIVPEAERRIAGQILWRGIAGYSLAGLFAVYSMYRTKAFTRIASASGSLWFPEFKEYVFSHEIESVPEYLYFSLGDKECRTRNIYMRRVQEHTEEIEAFYRQKGDTVYRLNPGNHFRDVTGRMASGIAWILERQEI